MGGVFNLAKIVTAVTAVLILLLTIIPVIFWMLGLVDLTPYLAAPTLRIRKLY